MEHAFTWASLIPGAADHTITATMVALALIGVAWVGYRQLANTGDPVVPDGAIEHRSDETREAWRARPAREEEELDDRLELVLHQPGTA